jgi:hypothetical protein
MPRMALSCSILSWSGTPPKSLTFTTPQNAGTVQSIAKLHSFLGGQYWSLSDSSLNSSGSSMKWPEVEAYEGGGGEVTCLTSCWSSVGVGHRRPGG